MPENIKSSIIKIVFFSFLIGLLVSFFDINPKELLANFGETVQDIFAIVADIIEWAVQYILLGAVVVVPIWLIFFAIGKLKK
jgi:Na+/H+-dicarboxylate symporter